MSVSRIRSTFDRRAPWYDAIVRLLSFGGDREYRRRAVAALRLRPGQRVLDVGCGTGLNFRLLSEAVGPSGLVVGKDLSHAMLREAPAAHAGRIQARASQRVFKPASFDAALSTYLISTLLGEGVLEPIVEAVRPGGRVVIVDDALPPGWFIGPGFMLNHHPRPGRPALPQETKAPHPPHLRNLRVTYCHGGMIYIIAGDRV